MILRLFLLLLSLIVIATCTNDCSHGQTRYHCRTRPCSLPAPAGCSHWSRCEDDYCGGCKRHYYDSRGNEICKQCRTSDCGRKPRNYRCPDDSIGGPTGKCLYLEGKCQWEIRKCPACPNNEEPVECLAEPCSLEAPDNCTYAYCKNDYCGGCNRHYYDTSDQEVCIPDAPTNASEVCKQSQCSGSKPSTREKKCRKGGYEGYTGRCIMGHRGCYWEYNKCPKCDWKNAHYFSRDTHECKRLDYCCKRNEPRYFTNRCGCGCTNKNFDPSDS